jgi:hypothetical protein
MSHLDCPCGSQLKIGAAHVNRALRCPKCHRVLRLVAGPDAAMAAPLAALVVEGGAGLEGMCLYLSGDKPIIFGKDEAVTLRLPASSVSRKHGTLEPAGATWRVVDSQSKNGVLVNGKRVVAQVLGDGDALQVGEFRLRYLPVNRLRAVAAKLPIPKPPAHAAKPGAASAKTASPSLTFMEMPHAPGDTAAIPPPLPVAKNNDELHFADEDGDIFPGAQPKSAPATGPQTCPQCKQVFAPEVRICVKCGIDLASGKSIMEGRGGVVDTGLGLAGDRGKGVRSGKDRTATSALPKSGSIRAYFRDCLRAFAFVTEPMELVKFVLLVILLGVREATIYIGPFGSALRWLIGGMFCAFLFNTIANAANGERDLPELSLEGGFFGAAIVPTFKFFFVSLIVGLPAIAYGVYFTTSGNGDLSLDVPIFLGLLVFGAFLWPLSMLATAIGGFTCFGRPDLIARTIARTFLPYLVVCVVSVGAMALFYFADAASFAMAAKMKISPMAMLAVLVILNAYMSIIAMQAIGLYYHHFKSRFAWSWG